MMPAVGSGITFGWRIGISDDELVDLTRSHGGRAERSR